MRAKAATTVLLTTAVAVVLALGTSRLQPVEAATQVTLWPATYTYATPSGTFTWNSTVFGLRFDQPLGPFVALRTSLYYGSVANPSFAGSALSGYTGQTLGGDVALRIGAGAGPVAVGGFVGYGGYALNAVGPGASDRAVLSTLGFRVGAEGTVSLSRSVALRANYTSITSQNSEANISLSAPPTAAQYMGTGTGQEYEIVLLFTPVASTGAFIGYRSGNYQTTWSGSGTTASSFDGWFAGVQLSF